MNNMEIIRMINDFPIGNKATTRQELLSKAKIVSYLARFQEQFSLIENIEDREETIEQFLKELLSVKEKEMPDLNEASRILQLSHDFINDFNKIEYIKRNNHSFNRTFELIADSINLNQISRKSR